MSIIDPPKDVVTKRMFVPEENVFIGAKPGSAIVIHKTGGGDGTAEGTAHYFQTETTKSAHFVIGQDGTVVQCVHLVDGAGANCCPDDSHNSWWDPLIARFTNLNLCTISIEHCDPSTENSTPLTAKQQAASFKLIAWLVDQYGLDFHHEIRGHNSINATICPGNYPFDALFSYLESKKRSLNPGADPTFQDWYWNVAGAEADFSTGLAKTWAHDVSNDFWRGSPIAKEGSTNWRWKDGMLHKTPVLATTAGFYTDEGGVHYWHENA